MAKAISYTTGKQEKRVCGHCRKPRPLWHFLANPVMPNSVDPFCYHCRVVIEQTQDPKKRNDSDRARKVRVGFAGIRALILTRDDHRCCICGDENYLEVHHIIPVSKGGGNESGNLVTLCLRHHRAAHRGEIRQGDLYHYAAHQHRDPELQGITPEYDDWRLKKAH